MYYLSRRVLSTSETSHLTLQVMKIIDNVRPDRQTVMFSATFPRQMEALARKILTKPIEVQVGGRSTVCRDVEQHVVSVDTTPQ